MAGVLEFGVIGVGALGMLWSLSRRSLLLFLLSLALVVFGFFLVA